MLKSQLSEDIVTGNHCNGSIYVLGSKTDGLQWHVFMLSLVDQSGSEEHQEEIPVCLEICMTDLHESGTKHFFKNINLSAKEITYLSGT